MLSKTPPMGFNTWNTFGENINEQLIKETADKMVELGLRDCGYEYLVIDDCWSKRERDPQTGKIVPDEEKFPNGMKAVSDYVHSKGLKFGMYSCAGTRTCADYPGSFDHEYLDAETFAEYGVDFLKYDFCYKPDSANGPLLYRKMGMALRACGREILFSACNWGNDEVSRWVRSAGAHMYRSTGDINDSFRSFADIALSQIDNLAYSAPGCFNDIDMLTVGMYGRGNVGSVGCSDIDYKTQFALWCMFSSPLMLGGDLRCMNDFCLDLVKNAVGCGARFGWGCVRYRPCGGSLRRAAGAEREEHQCSKSEGKYLCKCFLFHCCVPPLRNEFLFRRVRILAYLSTRVNTRMRKNSDYLHYYK